MRLDGHITIREKSVLSAPRGFFLLTKTGMSVVGISDQFNINTYFSFRAKCCFKGGVGGHFPSNLSWPGISVSYVKCHCLSAVLNSRVG